MSEENLIEIYKLIEEGKLIEFKEKINNANLSKDEMTDILIFAIYNEEIEYVKYLLEKGANPDSKGRFLFTNNQYLLGDIFKVTSKRNHPKAGRHIQEYTYRTYELDNSQNIIVPKSFKSNVFKKTIYNDNLFPDKLMMRMVIEAIEDSIFNNNFKLHKRKWEGYTKDGYKFEGYHNGNEITSFYFEF